MGSEAVDSDGSISWEDFFGTTTDLVPQLVGMFDELARKGDGSSTNVVMPSNCGIPVALQKRLSLIQPNGSDTMDDAESPAKNGRLQNVEITVCDADVMLQEAPTSATAITNEKSPFRRDSDSLMPLTYSRRCRIGDRPLSGSSIASSTSSSGCSNQENACTTNPYLASVESLADTCASSQGSGDSGVVTISEVSCVINRVTSQCRNSLEDDSLRYCERSRFSNPRRNPVERVLLEIVETEAVYVEHLRQVIQGYFIVLRDDPASLIQGLQLNDLFSNIEDIFDFNRNFLSNLENCGLDPVAVANLFIQHKSGFKVYTEYCTHYPRTVSILTDLMGQEELARVFRERQVALQHALPLGSFLLKPVQRILKYHLLLENLSKEFDADYADKNAEGEGRKAIEGALDAMTDIAKHINAMKRKHEHAVRVQEIQSLLYGWAGPDLTTCGELIAEGSFRMRGAKAPRHAFLFDKMLLLTKKKEDGLLVYKAHIMCSNLTLMESIPGEPLSFHVIPFDNSQFQYKLQARNMEQKREWTLQIKRVILENYNAVIPSHARQLVLQIGQNQSQDDLPLDKSSSKKQLISSHEYFDSRKIERERRRSEAGLRSKLKKSRKIDVATSTAENSPACHRKNKSQESILNFGSRDNHLNRSVDGRGSKVKLHYDRFTNWRRKSEPGFQSYINLTPSDEEDLDDQKQKEDVENFASDQPNTEIEKESEPANNTEVVEETKEIANSTPEQKQPQTVEQIVGHILMENHEFQRLIEKQRNGNHVNVHKQNFKNSTANSSEEDSEGDYATICPPNNKNRNRTRRRDRFVKANNAYNQRSSFQVQCDHVRCDSEKGISPQTPVKSPTVQKNQEKVFEVFKKNSMAESKVIRMALRIRESSGSGNEEDPQTTPEAIDGESHGQGFGNYDNLQHVWDGMDNNENRDEVEDCPTKPAVWLTNLCDGLPDSPQKCGSLPRSFQISPNSEMNVMKFRFLQRDGKPMTERPFTIASDKPAEINLEDMERYTSSCENAMRVGKFPTNSNSSSTYFFSVHDSSLTDADSEMNLSASTAHVHPEHKIYRGSGCGSSFKSVLSKAGNRLQNLRSTVSSETLDNREEIDKSKYFRSLSAGSTKFKRKSKSKASKETISDIEDVIGCMLGSSSNLKLGSKFLYYKQGSSDLGARIAQPDYADPLVLFSESKKNSSIDSNNSKSSIVLDDDIGESRTPTRIPETSEGDSFYERSFEIIENYADGDGEDAFRDSAIFSDVDETSLKSPVHNLSKENRDSKGKVPPPVPAKNKPSKSSSTETTPVQKPAITRKPEHLKHRAAKVLKGRNRETTDVPKVSSPVSANENTKTLCKKEIIEKRICTPGRKPNVVAVDGKKVGFGEKDDVSAGQSQVGWVRKMVGQLQSQNDS